MRTALSSVEGIEDINTDTSTRSCTFKAPADLDVDKILDGFADGGNTHIKGWSKK